MTEITYDVFSFLRARRRETRDYVFIWEGRDRKTRRITAFAPDVSDFLHDTTAPMNGVVCFSATMHPIDDMKMLIGADEDDACFSMPSPFPPENLLVLQKNINTRYQQRDATLPQIADCIRQLTESHPGKYMVFFPSFAYMEKVTELLDEDTYMMQQRSMSLSQREEFLARFLHESS
ncbi:MAG: hypothetical protein Q4C54_01710 [Clostridia bacterium]|nr:hypothetical protein [Clostridia bacterium]